MTTFIITIFIFFYVIPSIIVFIKAGDADEYFSLKERIAVSFVPFFNFVVACDVIYHWIKNEHHT